MKWYFYLMELSKIFVQTIFLHEIIICDIRDPPWINNRGKELINEKNDTCQRLSS